MLRLKLGYFCDINNTIKGTESWYLVCQHLQQSYSDSYTTFQGLWSQSACGLEIILRLFLLLRNSYTMGCPPVRGDNPRALASGLSYVKVDNPWYN